MSRNMCNSNCENCIKFNLGECLGCGQEGSKCCNDTSNIDEFDEGEDFLSNDDNEIDNDD